MKKSKLLNLVIFSIIFPCSVFSQVLIPFQATLTDEDHNPLQNGLYKIVFRIYEQPTGGSEIWTEDHEQVSIIYGRINVLLGHYETLDVSFDTTKYLGIEINDNGEMIPRHILTPSFHAYSATKAVSADHAGEASRAGFAPTADVAYSAPSAISVTFAQNAESSTNSNFAINAERFNETELRSYALKTQLDALVTLKNRLPEMMMPVGSISAFAGPIENTPNGYLPCHGQELNISDYPALHGIIGKRYGGTSNTFYLPDYRGRFLRGWNHDNPDTSIAPEAADRTVSTDMPVSDAVSGDHVGTKQGHEDGNLHTHSFTTEYQSPTNHTHSGTQTGTSLPRRGYSSTDNGYAHSVGNTTGQTGESPDHTHTGTANFSGDETRPVNITVMYIIKY